LVKAGEQAEQGGRAAGGVEEQGEQGEQGKQGGKRSRGS